MGLINRRKIYFEFTSNRYVSFPTLWRSVVMPMIYDDKSDRVNQKRKNLTQPKENDLLFYAQFSTSLNIIFFRV